MQSRKTLVIGVTINLEHYENLRLEVSGEVESIRDAVDLAAYLDDILGGLGRQDPATADRIDSYRRRVLARDTGRTPPETAVGCHEGVCPLPADILAEVAETPRAVSQVLPRTTGRQLVSPVSAPHPAEGVNDHPSATRPPLTDNSLKKRADTAPPPHGISRIGGTGATGGDQEPVDGNPSIAGPAPGESERSASPAKAPAQATVTGARGIPPSDSRREDERPASGSMSVVPPGAKEDRAATLTPGSSICELCHASITEAERKTSQLFTSKNLCRACMKRS